MSVPAKAEPVAPTDEEARRARLTLIVSADLLERVRNLVFWSPGFTLSSFGEYAVKRAVDELEKERGAPFPSRTGNVRIGRPPK